MTVKKFSESVPVSSGEELLAVDETAALLLCVVCAIGVFLMWQVPQLASGLISGGSFSTRGFGGGSIGRRLNTEAGHKKNDQALTDLRKPRGEKND